MVFNNTEYSRTDVELMVVITPHIVRPFEMGEKKEFYNGQAVRDALRLYLPAYPDAQGNLMNRLMTQGEPYRNFEDDLNTDVDIDEMLAIAKRINREPTQGTVSPEAFAASGSSLSTEWEEFDALIENVRMEESPIAVSSKSGNKGVFPGGLVPQ